MKEMPPGGYTGEWIVRVEGIMGPEQAVITNDEIRRVIAGIAESLGNAQVLFDRSRWEGGDF